MPSKREQFNVRMSPETAAKVERLQPVVNAALGVELTQAQFFALAVTALEEKYPLPPVTPPGAASEPTAGKPPQTSARKKK